MSCRSAALRAATARVWASASLAASISLSVATSRAPKMTSIAQSSMRMPSAERGSISAVIIRRRCESDTTHLPMWTLKRAGGCNRAWRACRREVHRRGLGNVVLIIECGARETEPVVEAERLGTAHGVNAGGVEPAGDGLGRNTQIARQTVVNLLALLGKSRMGQREEAVA